MRKLDIRKRRPFYWRNAFVFFNISLQFFLQFLLRFFLQLFFSFLLNFFSNFIFDFSSIYFNFSSTFCATSRAAFSSIYFTEVGATFRSKKNVSNLWNKFGTFCNFPQPEIEAYRYGDNDFLFFLKIDNPHSHMLFNFSIITVRYSVCSFFMPFFFAFFFFFFFRFLFRFFVLGISVSFFCHFSLHQSDIQGSPPKKNLLFGFLKKTSFS